ncbi:MAG: hypothetical protein ACRD2T_15775 [Thermoanaerobaculia bacterium]
MVPETLRRLALRKRKGIVPLLVEALKDRSPQQGGILPARRSGPDRPTARQVRERGEIRIAAANLLGDLGPDALDRWMPSRRSGWRIPMSVSEAASSRPFGRSTGIAPAIEPSQAGCDPGDEP